MLRAGYRIRGQAHKLWPAFRLVHDLDDTRGKMYGIYYTQKKPLTSAAFKGLPGI